MERGDIRAAVVTVSDTRTLADDASGDKLTDCLIGLGASVVARVLTTDDRAELEAALLELADREDINLILTTGGTGLAPRDNTPEATLAVVDREVRGISEAMRRETSAKTPMSMLSRGVAGTRGNTLIVNLPGSPKGVEECFEVLGPVLTHSIALLAGDTTH